MAMPQRSLRAYKKQAKQIAEDLAYPWIVREKIDLAQSEEAVDRVLRSARKGEYDKPKRRK